MWKNPHTHQTKYMEYKVACFSCDTSCNSIPFSYYYLWLLFDHILFTLLSFRFGFVISFLIPACLWLCAYISKCVTVCAVCTCLWCVFFVYAIHRKRNMLQNRRIKMNEWRQEKQKWTLIEQKWATQRGKRRRKKNFCQRIERISNSSCA